MADDHRPRGAHGDQGPHDDRNTQTPEESVGRRNTHDALDTQIREAARSMLGRHASAATRQPPAASRKTPGATTGVDDDAPDPAPQPAISAASRRRGHRATPLAVAAAVTAVIALVSVVLAVRGSNDQSDDNTVVGVDPPSQTPEVKSTLLLTLASDHGDYQLGGDTALLLDAETLDVLGEIRLPVEFLHGGLTGTVLEEVALVGGELAFAYSTYTDVISPIQYGKVAEATEMNSALWISDELAADQLSYYMQLGPNGTLLTADRGVSEGTSGTQGAAVGDTVVEDRWTVRTARSDNSEVFSWDDGPIPGHNGPAFTPDGSGVVQLNPSDGGATASIEVSALEIADSCEVCSADGRSFAFRSVELGLSIIDTGFIDDDTVWFQWADQTVDLLTGPTQRELGLATLDLRDGEITELPAQPGGIDPYESPHSAISDGDGTLWVVQADPQGSALDALLRWDGSEWTAVTLPPAPDGLEYQSVYPIPDRPDQLDGSGSTGRDAQWCQHDLEGPVPQQQGLQAVLLDVDGSEHQLSDIDGLAEVVDALEPGYGSASVSIWIRDCTIAIDIAHYYWDRLLLRFARTDDGRYALTGTDRLSNGPS